MKYILLSFSLIILIICGCTDIIETENQGRSSVLVIEGTVSNADESYLIKLSTTSTLSGSGGNELGKGAEVIIRTGSGTQVILNEVDPGGLYSTAGSSFKGEVGEEYQLYVKLANGEEYESPFEQIPPPVVILDVFAEARSEPVDGPFENIFFHDISIEVDNNPEKLEFFSVDITGIAEVSILYGEILTLSGINPCIPQDIKPLLCYAIRDSIINDIVIGTNAGVGSAAYMVDILSIPADFELKYLAQVRVNTISERGYQFLNSIKGQLDKEGSIFDSPFPGLVGNVRNIRTNELAQGYFFVSSISETQVCFDRSLLNFKFSTPEICALTGPDNCIEHWAPATFEVPEGFQLCL